MSTTKENLPDVILCSCSGTTRSHIERLFNQGMDMDAISRWTGAVSGCGGCEWDIEGLLIMLAKQRDHGEQAIVE
jgi:bacterioferritin-associated ferredoxin